MKTRPSEIPREGYFLSSIFCETCIYVIVDMKKAKTIPNIFFFIRCDSLFAALLYNFVILCLNHHAWLLSLMYLLIMQGRYCIH